jgi:formylglycine-generating enzyme required for sulfatase activity
MMRSLLSSAAFLALFQLCVGLLTPLPGEDAPPKDKPKNLEPKMAPGLEDAFELPKDAYGNPLRQGTDEKTGLPMEIRHKGTGMHFVFIPAGEFMMGSPENEKDREVDEGPVHKVKLTKWLYLGKYEVTQAEWKAGMGTSPSDLKGENEPVEQVSWNDCQEFVKKLNEALGARTGAGAAPPSGSQQVAPLRFALPTEAQWEYACRAGTQTRYGFGDSDQDLGNYAWFVANKDGKTHPVGGKKPNAWGLYDMHGNVLEWCQDWSGSYSKGEASDPRGPDGGETRVCRGGSWGSPAGDCRSALRGRFSPDSRYSILGFRLALRSLP